MIIRPCSPFRVIPLALCLSSSISYAISIPSSAISEPSGDFACSNASSPYPCARQALEAALPVVIRPFRWNLETAFDKDFASGQERRRFGVHQGGLAARSCRLCLIACNSRKFTRRLNLTATPEAYLR